MRGAAATADAMRVWRRGGTPIAIGLLDDDVLRLAIDPALADDFDVAQQLASDLSVPGVDVFPEEAAVLEARDARALRAHLEANGWEQDDAWVPLSLALSAEAPEPRSDLWIERVGVEAAAEWTEVHWSAFRGTAYEGDERQRIIDRWTTMMTGPLAELAQNLIGFDSDGTPVAVTTVWSAGEGRPGLIEPMGVHRDHHGRGYGRAITAAGAAALRAVGASSAVVAAEVSNPAAVATYRSAGFVASAEVTDLARTRTIPLPKD